MYLKDASIWNIHVSMLDKIDSIGFYKNPKDYEDNFYNYVLFFFSNPKINKN
jgi:hypothetical protein